MKVRILDYDARGETLRGVADLRDCFPDDDEEMQRALRELANAGRYWTGGGAAPLVLLTRL